MEPGMVVVLSLAHIVVALVATVLNLTATDRRIGTSLTRDGRRLRLAIRTELNELQTLCSENMKRLEEGKFAMSLRASIGVYRANLGRLNMLEESEIPVIVGAYARADKLEHLLAATMTASGSMVYKVSKDGSPIQEIIEQHYKVRFIARQAMALLDMTCKKDDEAALRKRGRLGIKWRSSKPEAPAEATPAKTV